MAKKWSEILQDPKAFPDDFRIDLGNGEVMSLGDMRSYDREHEGQLTAQLTERETKVRSREANLDTATRNLAGVLEKTAQAAGVSVEELIEGRIPSKKNIAAANDLDENDPIVGSLVKEIKSLKEQVSAFPGVIDQIKKNAIGPMLNTYLEDYYEGKWDKVAATLPKKSKLELKSVMEFAEKNGLKDSKGRLDLSKAARELTYDDRINEEAEKRVGEMRKKDDDERLMASVPKPGTQARFGTPKNFKDEKGHTKSLDQVMNDALQDTDMWKGIQGNA